MKYLTLLLGLFSLGTVAQEMPEWAKGGTVVFIDKNGQKHEFKAEEYKIVPRKQQALETRVVKVKPPRRNVFSLQYGFGPHGLKTESVNGGTEVSQQYSPVLGIGYSRKVGEDRDLLLGGTVQTNGTVQINLGKEY